MSQMISALCKMHLSIIVPVKTGGIIDFVFLLRMRVSMQSAKDQSIEILNFLISVISVRVIENFTHAHITIECLSIQFYTTVELGRARV